MGWPQVEVCMGDEEIIPGVCTDGECCLWYRTDFVPVCMPVTGETGGWGQGLAVCAGQMSLDSPVSCQQAVE